MRGKNIIWLTLIAALVSVSLVNLGYMQDELPILAVSPETIENEDMSLTYFSLDVTLTNVERLWGYGFTLNFAPFTATLNVIAVIEDPTFREYSPPYPMPGAKTWFTSNVDTVQGTLSVGCTRKHDFFTYPDGYTGSLRLCTIMFSVVNAGDSPLTLTDTSITRREPDPDPANDWMYIPMDHIVVSGNYKGPNVKMLRPHGKIADHKVHVGDAQVMRMRVVNDSPVPMWVKVRFVIQRADGEAAYIYSGQAFTGLGPEAIDYLYVDGYIPAVNQWTLAGPPEALFGEPDGSYIESNSHCSLIGFYTFEDVALGGRLVEDVDLEAYSRCQAAGPDIDSYVYTYDEYGNVVMNQAWGDSQGGTTYWDWTKGKYYDGTDYDMPQYYGGHILTEQGINSCELLLHNYGGGFMQVDAYRLEVTYSKYNPVTEPTYYLLPGEEAELSATWFMSSYDVGQYYCQATAFYSANPGEFFIRAHNPPAFSFNFQCLP